MNPSEPFEFKRLYGDIAFELSQIYWELRPTGWAENFIYYRSLNFAYQHLCDIKMPLMELFFAQRSFYLQGFWVGEWDVPVNHALDEVGFGDRKSDYWGALFNYVFDVMPVQIGFPKEYLNESKYEKFKNFNSFIYEVMKFENIVDERGLPLRDEQGFQIEKPFEFFDEIDRSIKDLVGGVVKREAIDK